MTRTPVTPILTDFPRVYRDLLAGATVYDSSCSQRAKVYFIHRADGYFLKCAPAGTLKREVEMTRYFHSLGLAAQVIDARQEDGHDWLLTARMPGEDAIYADHLAQPERLCDLFATYLRALHEMPTGDCPGPTHTETYLARAKENYRTGNYDASHFPDNWGYDTPAAAMAVIEAQEHRLQCNTLLHGDYCLPNIMLKNWQVTGLIDLDNAGVGDRHVDLFWGAWSLNFNLGTDAYRNRFFDAYGRDAIDETMFPLISACEVFS